MFYEIASLLFLLTTLALSVFIYKNFGREKENPETLARIDQANKYVEDLKGTLLLQNQTLDNSNQAVRQADLIIRGLKEQQADLQVRLDFQQQQYQKLLGQKKSSEVRTGRITEQIAPFLEGYPENVSTAHFLGEPLDFVHFNTDGIVFVEVKSGNSQLNKHQRDIRDLIKAGKVSFKLYRVKGDDNGTD